MQARKEAVCFRCCICIYLLNLETCPYCLNSKAHLSSFKSNAKKPLLDEIRGGTLAIKFDQQSTIIFRENVSSEGINCSFASWLAYKLQYE